MGDKKPKKKKTLVDYILTLILLVAIGVFCYAGYNLFTIFMEYKAGTDEYNDIAQMAVTVRDIKEDVLDSADTKGIDAAKDENGRDVDKTAVENKDTIVQDDESDMMAIVSENGNTIETTEEVPTVHEETSEYAIVPENEVLSENGEHLAELVIELLKGVAEADKRIKKNDVQVLQKPLAEEKIEIEKIEEAEIESEKSEPKEVEVEEAESEKSEPKEVEVEEAESEKKELKKIEEAESVINESEVEDVSSEKITKTEATDLEVQSDKELSESDMQDILQTLQNTYKEIVSILNSMNQFKTSERVHSSCEMIFNSIGNLILRNSIPALGAVDRLFDCFTTAISCYENAKEIRENGPSLQAPLEVDFEVLQGINEDVIGWIYVEALDTINYPMVRGVDNDKYLHHTYEGKYNFAGTIFIDYENSRDFSDCNTVVYGHNMKNGSMFGQLKKFVGEPETYEKSKYFWILTPEADYRYEIIAAYTTDVNSDTYTFFSGPGKKFLDYLEKIRSWSSIKTNGRKLTVRDKVVTLSTCTGNESTRFVVQGVRVNTVSK